MLSREKKTSVDLRASSRDNSVMVYLTDSSDCDAHAALSGKMSGANTIIMKVVHSFWGKLHFPVPDKLKGVPRDQQNGLAVRLF